MSRQTFRFLVASAAIFVILAGTSPAIRSAAAPALPSDDAAITQLLNRLTFGVRPGDVERVRELGVEKWLEQQLHPAGIPDPGMTPRLARLTTLTLDPGTIAVDYIRPAREARRKRQLENGGTPGEPGMMPPPGGDPAMDPAAGARRRDDTQEMRTEIQRERQVFTDLAEAKILRAVYSERQLEEVLVDFWFNHFNVFARKGQTEVYVGDYERQAIRPYVLGSFRELLGATARHPAMLFYLDNWLSADPNATLPRQGRRAQNMPPPQRQARGLNENYARELLELHTLGVDGGYTQQDVVNVARAFTGWTIGRPDEGFRFAAPLHDRGEKTVLGQRIPAGGGIEDGERVLDLLAKHPSTARHIATKLAQRFVSDTPPAALVERAAERFRATNGNLREVVRAIVTSPEFFAADARGAKIKTPFEFVVSAMRATAAQVATAMPLMRTLQTLGMPPYMCQPPTGYDDTAESWVSSGALVNRINFSLELAENKVRGVRVADRAAALRVGSPEFQKQ